MRMRATRIPSAAYFRNVDFFRGAIQTISILALSFIDLLNTLVHGDAMPDGCRVTTVIVEVPHRTAVATHLMVHACVVKGWDCSPDPLKGTTANRTRDC